MGRTPIYSRRLVSTVCKSVVRIVNIMHPFYAGLPPHFFNGISILMIQGYGMPDMAAPFAFTHVGDLTIGSVN